MPELSFKLHVVKSEEKVGEDGAKTYEVTLVPVVEGTGLTLVSPAVPIILSSANPADIAGLDTGYDFPIQIGEKIVVPQG